MTSKDKNPDPRTLVTIVTKNGEKRFPADSARVELDWLRVWRHDPKTGPMVVGEFNQDEIIGWYLSAEEFMPEISPLQWEIPAGSNRKLRGEYVPSSDGGTYKYVPYNEEKE